MPHFVLASPLSSLDHISSLFLDTVIKLRVSCHEVEFCPATQCYPLMALYAYEDWRKKVCMLLFATSCTCMPDQIRRLLSQTGSDCHCRHDRRWILSQETRKRQHFCFRLVGVITSVNVKEGIANCTSQGKAVTWNSPTTEMQLPYRSLKMTRIFFQ